MRDASAFDDVVFLGLARTSKRDPYRLGLFARHVEPDERPTAVLAIRGGSLLVTDRRILELRPHLEVRGAWNVKEFLGYELRREVPRASVQDVEHRIVAAPTDPHAVEDVVRLVLPDGAETIVVSRGPEPTLSEEEFATLRRTILDQAK